MYLDKLYNKLFSENNIDGINTLLKEVKIFSDPSNRINELTNIINLKKQRGQDYSAEMRELTQLQSQKGGGFDLSRSLEKLKGNLVNANMSVSTLGSIANGLKNIGSMFIPVSK